MKKEWYPQDLAERFGKSRSVIRLRCIRMGLGVIRKRKCPGSGLTRHVRILSTTDMKKLEKYFQTKGQGRNNQG